MELSTRVTWLRVAPSAAPSAEPEEATVVEPSASGLAVEQEEGNVTTAKMCAAFPTKTFIHAITYGSNSSCVSLGAQADGMSTCAAASMGSMPCAALPCPARFPSARAPPCPSRRPCLRAALLVARHPALHAMASLNVLTFDHEGRLIRFDTWLDDQQLYLLSDSRDSVSLFDHTAGAFLAPLDTADIATRSQDHFLALDPTDLTVDMLEKHLLAAETSIVAVGAACGTPRTPFFEGCSPSPLGPSYASAVAVDILVLRRSGRSGSGGSGGGGGGGSGSGGGGSGGGRGGAVKRGGCCGGQRQQQQLREWFAQRGASGGSVRCPYVIRTGDHAGQTCGKFHRQHRCFSRLDDARRAELGDEAERPRWLELLRSGVDIFALDYDAILAAMYALTVSAEGDCYLCVPPPCIEVAALGANECALPGTAPAGALHTFTLDSGASRCFFRDSTTLTPLPAPVPVRLTDPLGGPVLARSTTVLLCPAVLSGSLSGLHLPSFYTNSVSTAALQDVMVTTITPGGQRVAICMCTRTGRHLATFTHQPGSSLYTLTTEPAQVAAFGQVSASGQVAAPCSCRLLLHQTLLLHHRLGHPSLPRLRGMHSRLLVSGLPMSLPPLPPSPAPPCLPRVEGWHRATPHSSSFPATTAPLRTLHMDVWGPARVSGQGRERYFLLVVDD
ncbi:unnamed protein product [Closterium sp. NIES-53]